ncbi:MAG: glycosyltransferase [Candidatus Peribacter sp.]|jgi:hypothetical protein|nr:glycosyltransferase [Candidatus Peribacter sp.]MBT4392619.1 glycosyltransferase [Candidatus Peribacter sp.]MBT4601488.1 glycosyltransferase [Candidatus Peribacter sp.]MBT5149511.1 glycosyltransferase [Candidatus Peribacter sp.]MBT5638642.1 glycosyltransferase [Candidatus Peribacter sp.]
MLKIDCILDRFSFDCFTPEVALRQVPIGGSPSKDADLFFVESSWDSVYGGWYLGTDQYRTELEKLIDEYNALGIPTVFWAKEDPVQIHRFKWITPRFDFLCTTDEECVDRHKEMIGHDRVITLPFAAQPDLQYCDSSIQRENVPCFAGVNYGDQFPRRLKEIGFIVDPAMPFGLHLYDRGLAGNFYLFQPTFGPEYSEALKPSVTFDQMGRIYRSYSVFLNIGCVQDSPTMFSRRVFEVLASGTPLISAYSKGIDNLFGDEVHLSRNEQETTAHLNELLNNTESWKESSLKGQRAIFRKHTYAHRLRTILEHCGLEVPQRTKNRILHYERASHAVTQESIDLALPKREHTIEPPFMVA